MALRKRHGGTCTRISLAEAQPLGDFDVWRQSLPITMLELNRPRTSPSGKIFGDSTEMAWVDIMDSITCRATSSENMSSDSFA